MSGGIDSEITAETFYQLGIPFEGITLRLFDGKNDFDLLYVEEYCKKRNIQLYKTTPYLMERAITSSKTSAKL